MFLNDSTRSRANALLLDSVVAIVFQLSALTSRTAIGHTPPLLVCRMWCAKAACGVIALAIVASMNAVTDVDSESKFNSSFMIEFST